MKIEESINKFFYYYFENSLQNIEIINSVNSEIDIKKIFAEINKEIVFGLNTSKKELFEHFFKIGKILHFDYNLSLIIIINLLEKLKDEILFGIMHKNIDYNENEFSSRINIIIQSISKGYLIETAKQLINSIKKENIITEISISCHKLWYKKFLQYLINLKTKQSILIYEKSDCFKWINSLDFKLLSKAATLESKSEIIIYTEKIFDIAREINYYICSNDFKNAYYFLIILDQALNILSNNLKNILINFSGNKLYYFFKLFSESIFFKKEYMYFLVFSIKPSNKILHKKDINQLFLNLFTKTKKQIQNLNYDFTGIINDTKSIHFLISYKEKEHITNIFDYIKAIIQSLREKEIILNVPDFFLRATNTEILSGLDANLLQKITYIMMQEKLDKSYYHFNNEESKELIKKAKKEALIDKEIQNAIENKNIEIYFQPIMHIKNNTKKLSYCEALSRLNINGKLIDAEDFIKYVIKENYTSSFDILVYEKLAAMAQDISKVLKGISFNIFPTSFVDTDVINSLKNTLKIFQKYNLFAILEITEYNLFKYYKILKLLKEEFPNTLQIAIDDFGSGYSSFSTLINLSQENLLDIVKIDGSITKNILKHSINLDILKMAISIVKKLKKKTIIEFIENEKIEEKIKEETHEFYGQGYLYAKALPLEKIKNLVNR